MAFNIPNISVKDNQKYITPRISKSFQKCQYLKFEGTTHDIRTGLTIINEIQASNIGNITLNHANARYSANTASVSPGSELFNSSSEAPDSLRASNVLARNSSAFFESRTLPKGAAAICGIPSVVV